MSSPGSKTLQLIVKKVVTKANLPRESAQTSIKNTLDFLLFKIKQYPLIHSLTVTAHYMSGRCSGLQMENYEFSPSSTNLYIVYNENTSE